MHSALDNVTVFCIFAFGWNQSWKMKLHSGQKKVQIPKKNVASLEKTAKLVTQTLLHLRQCMFNLINVIQAILKDSSMPNTTRQPRTPQSAFTLHTSGRFRYALGLPFSLVLPWVSPPSADRAAALLLLASEAWVGVSSRLRTLLSTGAANERRAIDSVPVQTRKTEQTKGKRTEKGWGITQKRKDRGMTPMWIKIQDSTQKPRRKVL